MDVKNEQIGNFKKANRGQSQNLCKQVRDQKVWKQVEDGT